MQQTTLVLADRYELGATLGEGGMARVYRATDATLHRQVAVKVLSAPYDRDEGYVERFRREAHAAARLNHPNIVTVFDTGEDDGKQFIVMELVEGETLGARLRRDGPLSPEDVASVGAAVAAALSEAHTRGVIHRDVKPGNVMLTEDGRVKVLDFGIARASGAEAFTRTGLVMGSASYLSPEQAQGGSGDARSDVYALGCVLYQMVAGRPPFVADDPVAALYQHVNEPVPPPSSIRAVPAELEAVILRCLAKQPEDRFDSAADLEAALLGMAVDPTATLQLPPTEAETTEPVRVPAVVAAADLGASPPRPKGTHRARRSPWMIAGAVLAGLLILGSILWLADPFGGDVRADLRDARRDASSASGVTVPSETPSTVGVPTVDEAAAALFATIETERASGQIDDKTAKTLTDRAEAIIEAYAAGGSEIDAAIGDFTATVAGAIDQGKLSTDSTASIADALDALVVAMATDPPIGATSGTTTLTGPTGETNGNDHGPPAHANSGGNDKGHGPESD